MIGMTLYIDEFMIDSVSIFEYVSIAEVGIKSDFGIL